MQLEVAPHLKLALAFLIAPIATQLNLVKNHPLLAKTRAVYIFLQVFFPPRPKIQLRVAHFTIHDYIDHIRSYVHNNSRSNSIFRLYEGKVSLKVEVAYLSSLTRFPVRLRPATHSVTYILVDCQAQS